MAKYIVCENCNAFIEYNPTHEYKGGTSYTTFKCPKCGHVKKTSINHIHYGQDGRK